MAAASLGKPAGEPGPILGSRVRCSSNTSKMETSRGRNQMTDMIDLQRTIVADHIADLEREWDALRAERDHDRRDHITTSTPSREPAHRPPRRVRLGRWLVAVGRAL